jgi:hypothetical protein
LTDSQKDHFVRAAIILGRLFAKPPNGKNSPGNRLAIAMPPVQANAFIPECTKSPTKHFLRI